MDRKTIKIFVALVGSFFIVTMVTKKLFLPQSPRVDSSFVASLPQQTKQFFISLFSERASLPTAIIPSPLPVKQQEIIDPTPYPSIAPTAIKPQATVQPKPTTPPAVTTTTAPTPTKAPIKPSPTTAPTPTTRPTTAGGCPTTSNQTYKSVRQSPNTKNKIRFDLSKNPDTNLYLRGYYEVQESTELISRRGNNTGLDPNMPPQISTLFSNHYPKIIKTYRVNAWDYEHSRNVPGESATPAYSVHVLGLEATSGESLVGLKAGRTIDGTNVFLVLYATKNYLLGIHANEDSWDEYGPPGYPFYFLDICVDPNLLALYEKNASEGRNELPGIATGQVFGYAMGNEVKFVIRDTMSFMDTRYKEDWWEYGK